MFYELSLLQLRLQWYIRAQYALAGWAARNWQNLMCSWAAQAVSTELSRAVAIRHFSPNQAQQHCLSDQGRRGQHHSIGCDFCWISISQLIRWVLFRLIKK
eukprot:6491225-Amphidinium_carterae.2